MVQIANKKEGKSPEIQAQLAAAAKQRVQSQENKDDVQKPMENGLITVIRNFLRL